MPAKAQGRGKGKSDSTVGVYTDHEGRTCIKVGEMNGTVQYIPLSIIEGLEVVSIGVKSFKDRYRVLEGYPIERGCEMFATYAQKVGATEEAIKQLGQFTKLTKEVIAMATKRKAKINENPRRGENRGESTRTAKAKRAAGKATEAGKPERKPAKNTPAKKAPAKKAVGKTGKYKSAAVMFRELIMKGRLTDDKIFEQVQKEFGLDDSKRSYVKWYRNDLIKKGENPPEGK